MTPGKGPGLLLHAGELLGEIHQSERIFSVQTDVAPERRVGVPRQTSAAMSSNLLYGIATQLSAWTAPCARLISDTRTAVSSSGAS